MRAPEAPPPSDEGVLANGQEDAVRSDLLATIARADSFLDGYCDRPSVQWLDRDALVRIASSVARDRVLLEALRERGRTAVTLDDLTLLTAQVTTLRPRNYTDAVDHVHDLTELSSGAEANAAVLADLEAILRERTDAGQDIDSVRTDVGVARLLSSRVTLAIAAARDAALQVTAASDPSALQVVADRVRKTTVLLDRLAATLMLAELAIAPDLL
jgi:hypothetical protein